MKDLSQKIRSTIVPANPGFYHLNLVYGERMDGVVDVTRDPVVAWVILNGEIEHPVTVGGHNPEFDRGPHYVLSPDGQVFGNDSIFGSYEEWLEALGHAHLIPQGGCRV